MNKLTKDKLNTIFKDGKNLTDKPIFIDFYADWWGPCRLFNSVLDEVVPEYKDKINMYKVDISEEDELAAMFGARSIPYMIFISKSGDVSMKLGSLNEDELKYYYEGLILKN